MWARNIEVGKFHYYMGTQLHSLCGAVYRYQTYYCRKTPSPIECCNRCLKLLGLEVTA
jgi:hypothetical protein